jgi:BlaI family transcriptional regulator, penicillinase repressor
MTPLEPRLSRRERQIMDVFHAKGEATASEVLEALPDPPGYSAVRALLRILESKGHLKHRSEGVRYVYSPIGSPDAARRSALRRVIATFFQGSAADAVAALLEDSDAPISKTELTRLQALIQQARKEGR